MSSPTIALQVSWQELKLIHVALCQARIGAARKGEDGRALDELSQRVAGLRLDLLPVPADSKGKLIVETILKPMLRPKA